MPGKKGMKQNSRRQMSPMQRDMAAVYGQDETEDKTEGQKRCRQWLKDSPSAFMARLHAMETGQAKGAQIPETGERAAEKAEAEDEGEVRAVELIERLLQEFEDGRERSVEGAVPGSAGNKGGEVLGEAPGRDGG